MNKSIHKLLGKLLLSSAALCWMSCDSESVSSPSNEPVPSSSSNPVPNSSSETPASSSSGPETSSSEVQANSSSSNNVPSSSSSNPAPSSSETSAPTSSSETPAPNSSSETPASSSSGASKAFINIEEELSKLKRPDTTGLRGTCISEMSHCFTIENFYATYSDEIDAERIASEKIEKLLQSEQALSFSLGKLKCYEDMIGYSAMPDYGISWCYSSDREIKTDDSCEAKKVRIDDEYIEALINNDLSKRHTYQRTFEKINRDAAECDALE